MRNARLPDLNDTWTLADARLLLDEWRDSGMSLAAFSRQRGIAPARLYWWKKRLASSALPSLSLIPATVVELDAETTAAMVVRLPNGISIEIATGSPSVVAALVAELTRTSR